MFKILNGTRPSNHICHHCEHSLQIHTEPQSHDQSWCLITKEKATVKVVECNRFSSHEMEMTRHAMFSGAVELEFDYKGDPRWTRNGKPYGPKKTRKVTRRSGSNLVKSNPARTLPN